MVFFLFFLGGGGGTFPFPFWGGNIPWFPPQIRPCVSDNISKIKCTTFKQKQLSLNLTNTGPCRSCHALTDYNIRPQEERRQITGGHPQFMVTIIILTIINVGLLYIMAGGPGRHMLINTG